MEKAWRRRGEAKKEGKETEGRQGVGVGEEARECQQGSCVDVNKGGRISFRRTAILPAKDRGVLQPAAFIKRAA